MLQKSDNSRAATSRRAGRGERDLVAVVLPQVPGLLADLDDAPEEGILVGRVGAVALDDGVDPAVLGEIHSLWGVIEGRGDMGVGLIVLSLDGSILVTIPMRLPCIGSYWVVPVC